MLVERGVDVGDVERLDGRRPVLDCAHLGLDRAREREIERIQEGECLFTHHDDELRLDDVQLADEERPGLVLVFVGELEAVRPVDRERIDAEPLQRLEHRLTRPSVEGDPLLYLRRLRSVLEEEDVGARVPGPDDRDPLALGGARDLVAELVDLGDRLLQVALIDLVGGCRGHGGHIPVLAYRTLSLTWATHFSD